MGLALIVGLVSNIIYIDSLNNHSKKQVKYRIHIFHHFACLNLYYFFQNYSYASIFIQQSQQSKNYMILIFSRYQ